MGRIGVWVYGLFTILKLLEIRRTFDIIHAHQAAEAAFFSVISGFLLRKKVIVKFTNSGEFSDRNHLISNRGRFIGSLFWKIILRADRFICINSRIDDEIAEFGIDDSRRSKIPNGVRIEDPEAVYAPFKELEIKLDGKLKKNAVKILFLGKFYNQKGIDVLLRAWSTVNRECSGKAQLLILGNGPERKNLKELTVSLGLVEGEDVLFSRSWISSPELYLCIVDLLVLPSRSEGMPNVVLEAMERSLPTVATRIPGISDLIEDPETGLLVEPEDSSSLAECLIKLISDRKIRRNMGRFARERVVSLFSIEKITDSYQALYKDLIEAVNPGANREYKSSVSNSEKPWVSSSVDENKRVEACEPPSSAT